MMNFKEELLLWEASSIVQDKMEYRRWFKEIPYLKFKEEWEVKIVPPYLNAVVRFIVRNPKTDLTASVYLDCYDQLGCVGEPYWEVYLTDIERFSINDTNGLLNHLEVILANENV